MTKKKACATGSRLQEAILAEVRVTGRHLRFGRARSVSSVTDIYLRVDGKLGN